MNSGSEFYNYKNFFSIVLLALVDAQYNFLYVNVGCQGRISDGGVFKGCELFRRLEKNLLKLPKPAPISSMTTPTLIPYYFVGDEAFPLCENIMKVYTGNHNRGTRERVFNYRLCRARRVVENAFGIVSSVFRLLRKPLLVEASKATTIVVAITHLHNFLRRNAKSANVYSPPGSLDKDRNGAIIPGSWRRETESSTSLFPLVNRPRRSAQSVKQIKDIIAEYLKEDGALPWQDEYA